MALKRRSFLKVSSAAMAVGASFASGAAVSASLSSRERLLMVSGYRDTETDSRFGILVMDTEGRTVADFAVPDRVHMADICPHIENTAPAVLVNSRTPGAPLRRYDLAGKQQAALDIPAELHFEGHTVFSADGRTLFATASDYRNGEGRVLVADAVTLELKAVWSSGGTGPHELVRDGDFLLVANTGVRTHPDSGRTPLNIETMSSQLVKISTITGDVVHTWKSPMQALSIRHLDVLPDHSVLVGCQYQRDDERPPCVALAHPQRDEIELLEPDNQWLAWDMQGYTASVRAFPEVSPLAGQAIISNPRGHLLTSWAATEGIMQKKQALQSSKGICLRGREGWITAGAGELWYWSDGELLRLSEQIKPGIWWENHMHGRVLNA